MWKTNFALCGIRTHDPPAFAASVLTARPRGPHGRERTTPRLILKHLESISPQSYFVCVKLFCKTNLKLKVLKLIKTKCNAKPWRHKIDNII